MPHFPGKEPAEAVLRSLIDALDQVGTGILLLDPDLGIRLANRRQAEIFGLTPAFLATQPTFRDLLKYFAEDAGFVMEVSEVPAYLDNQEEAVRDGDIPPMQIELCDGRRLLFACSRCVDGGRILSYVDISQELRQEAQQAMELISGEMRFHARAMEDQAARMAALAETADQNARAVEEARQELEHRIARQLELEAELRRLATTDALTGVMNRAGFLEAAQHRAQATNEGVVVMMIDVDHFKQINDSYGHAAGDEALRHLAVTLTAMIRGTDLLGRLGGEEFAILLSATLAEADVFAERLRVLVAAQPVQFENELIRMTISIGLAIQHDADAKFEQILARADRALYAAKRRGRNRVVADCPTLAN